MNKKEMFRSYMQQQKIKKNGKPIKPSVIDIYIKELGKLSDYMYEAGIIGKRIYSMESYEEICESIKKMRKAGSFEGKNKETQNRLNKALNYYEAFAAYAFKNEENAKEESVVKEKNI